MQVGEGKLHAAIFHQAQWWTDVHGAAHRLTEMSSAYRRNVIRHLLENAEYFHLMQRLYRSLDRLEDTLNGMPHPEPDPLPHDAFEWIETTALMRRLRELERPPQSLRSSG